ncbi:MAG: cytochrome c biogenesis protein CcsA [Myxococcota bacterium]
MNILLAHRIVAVLYVMIGLASLVSLIRPARVAHRTIAAALASTAAAHLLVIVAISIQTGGLPVTNIRDDFSLFAFAAAVVASIIGLRPRVGPVAPLASILVAGLMVFVFVEVTEQPMPPRLQSGWLPVHIATAFFGDALFLTAGIVSLLYLVQERRLKRRKAKFVPDGPYRLPPLEVLDQLSLRLLQFGFPLLTIGLLTGSLYGRQYWGSYWIWDGKNTLALIIWLLYAVLLHFRLSIGWRGRRVAYLTVIGVFATLVSMVGVNLAQVGTHGKDYLL